MDKKRILYVTKIEVALHLVGDESGYKNRLKVMEELDDILEALEPFKMPEGAAAEMISQGAPEPSPYKLPGLKAPPEKIGRQCPKCGRDLVIRKAKTDFIGCIGFPICTYTEQLPVKVENG